MKKNTDSNQIVIHRDFYATLMAIANKGVKSLTELGDAGAAEATKQALLDFERHVCKFNAGEHTIRKAARRQVADDRVKLNKAVIGLVQANTDKVMWYLHPTLTRNQARVYYKVILRRRSIKNKQLVTVRCVMSNSNMDIPHIALYPEMPGGYCCWEEGTWANIATVLYPEDMPHARKS